MRWSYEYSLTYEQVPFVIGLHCFLKYSAIKTNWKLKNLRLKIAFFKFIVIIHIYVNMLII